MDAAPAPTIRRGVPADAAEVAEVHVASWRVAYRGLLPDEVLAAQSVEERTASWAGYLVDGTGGRTFVALLDGKVRGFATIGRGRDDDVGPATGELWALYLHPEVWRRGVGSALMETVTRELGASGYDRVVLWVLADNDRGRRFYEHHGWRVEGRTKLEDGKDEIRYELRA